MVSMRSYMVDLLRDSGHEPSTVKVVSDNATVLPTKLTCACDGSDRRRMVLRAHSIDIGQYTSQRRQKAYAYARKITNRQYTRNNIDSDASDDNNDTRWKAMPPNATNNNDNNDSDGDASVLRQNSDSTLIIPKRTADRWVARHHSDSMLIKPRRTSCMPVSRSVLGALERKFTACKVIEEMNKANDINHHQISEEKEDCNESRDDEAQEIVITSIESNAVEQQPEQAATDQDAATVENSKAVLHEKTPLFNPGQQLEPSQAPTMDLNAPPAEDIAFLPSAAAAAGDDDNYENIHNNKNNNEEWHENNPGIEEPLLEYQSNVSFDTLPSHEPYQWDQQSNITLQDAIAVITKILQGIAGIFLIIAGFISALLSEQVAISQSNIFFMRQQQQPPYPRQHHQRSKRKDSMTGSTPMASNYNDVNGNNEPTSRMDHDIEAVPFLLREHISPRRRMAAGSCAQNYATTTVNTTSTPPNNHESSVWGNHRPYTHVLAI